MATRPQKAGAPPAARAQLRLLDLLRDVRENVDPSGTLSDMECISFLEKVGLWEFLERQGGLDAPANEQSLSAGQSQLLVLARALAHPSSIMMMDEITSR